MGQYLRVKICGVTSAEDALHAAAFGADAVGLNFHPESPRHVDLATARRILAELPPFVEPVGVFVNQATDRISRETLEPLGTRIRTVQLHGDCPQPDGTATLRIIRACPVRDRGSLEAITRELRGLQARGRHPAAVLLDGSSPGRYGGTGQAAPWDLLADFRPGVPVILAGGLTPENVAEAVWQVRPYAVDVATGVETEPARKDPDKLRRFIHNARQAAARYL